MSFVSELVTMMMSSGSQCSATSLMKKYTMLRRGGVARRTRFRERDMARAQRERRGRDATHRRRFMSFDWKSFVTPKKTSVASLDVSVSPCESR